MPSPFPGMDPYLEAPTIWSDLHGALATAIRGRLNAQLRPKYVARLTPTVTYDWIEITESAVIRPDVGVWQVPPVAGQVDMTDPRSTVAAPVESLVLFEVPTELYTVEIRTVVDMTLVTAIEILSPVNKRRGHDAFEGYQHKRRDLLRSTANLIEIDLLRAGERPPLEKPVPQAPYYVTVCRRERRPKAEVWPIQLDETLPVIPVPLRRPDADATLDLAATLAEVYEEGGYDMLVDYRQAPPPPPLSDAEAAWLEARLAQQGLR